MAVTRRDFIGVAAAAVVLGGLGTAGVATTSVDAASAPLRPPGGQDEARMLARCVRCDRCRSACPTDCIVLATPEDGLARMRTPLVSYKDGGCTFCDRCIDACPTGALAPFDPHAEKIGLAQVNADACVAFRSPGSCKLCQDACAFDAIVISEGHPKVVRERCNGCGLCEAACWGRGRDDTGATVRGIEVRTVASVTPADEDANVASAAEAAASAAGDSRDGEVRATGAGGRAASRRDGAASSSHEGAGCASEMRDASAASSAREGDASAAGEARSTRGEGER